MKNAKEREKMSTRIIYIRLVRLHKNTSEACFFLFTFYSYCADNTSANLLTSLKQFSVVL